MEGAEFISRIGGIVCKKCEIPVCDCEKDYKLAEKNGKPLRVDAVKDMEAF